MNAARLRILPFVGFLLPFDFAVAAVILLSKLASVPVGMLRRNHPVFPLADTTTVTIQILNWDGKPLLAHFLPSVMAAAGSHRVVVVDNGSRDGSVEFLRREFPAVDVITLDRNHGFAGGNNLGVERVQTDIVVFLNNDMAVDRDFLAPLLTPFSDSSVFAVASSIVVADPAKAGQETGRTRARFERGFFYLWHEAITSPAPQPVFWAGGGACAIDRRKYRALGGFDSLYRPFYVEDADLSYQAWKRGWKSLLAPESRVQHKHRGTSAAKFGDDFVDNTTRRNLYLLLWKNVTDSGMLFQHLVQLPSIHGRAMLQHGAAFEIRAYLRAVLRLPLALWRGMINTGQYRLSDPEVLRISQ